jgi:hypothetical protein
MAYHRQRIDPEILIKSLISNAQAMGNRPLEQRLADLTVWFYRNRKSIPSENLHLRQKLSEDALWIMLEVVALTMDRLQELEHRGRSEKLWIPNGIKVEGDLVTHAD